MLLLPLVSLHAGEFGGCSPPVMGEMQCTVLLSIVSHFSSCFGGSLPMQCASLQKGSRGLHNLTFIWIEKLGHPNPLFPWCCTPGSWLQIILKHHQRPYAPCCTFARAFGLLVATGKATLSRPAEAWQGLAGFQHSGSCTAVGTHTRH